MCMLKGSAGACLRKTREIRKDNQYMAEGLLLVPPPTQVVGLADILSTKHLGDKYSPLWTNLPNES